MNLDNNRKDRRVVGIVAIVGVIFLAGAAAAVAFWPQSISENATVLTHTIKRGKLIVSVTEQGTLESSNNTEIKCKIRGFSTVTYVVPTGTIVEEGQELVRLDTKVIEEQFSLTKTNTFIAEATLAESQANVEKAKIAIEAYEKGRYLSQLQQLEKELAAHQRNLRTARKMQDRSQDLFRKGYVTELEVEGNAFSVTQAELELKVKETEISVLENFTRRMQLETLRGNITASESKLAADQAGLAMEEKRRDRAAQELDDCVIRAEKSGLVIYPSAASWKTTPDITEGATVRKDQVLLLMPDLTQMQVKLGIHESVIDRVQPGLTAVVTLPDRELQAAVSDVATVTRPAGWWTGNVVKYDTVIELPNDPGLKPGMSAEIEVVLAVHENVLLLPVAAVVETEEGRFCWIATETLPEKRSLKLGDSNDIFIEVLSGIDEGDQVILNPTALIDEAAEDALTSLEQNQSADNQVTEDNSASANSTSQNAKKAGTSSEATK
ncbi:hypothetical protein OAA19_01795 [Rubripirellula sp.]|nr:hypothetical protein [Rubripirellula sp.]